MSLLEEIEKYFGSANIIALTESRNIFRCLKLSSTGTPYQVVYVDSSNNWVDEDFNTKVGTLLVDDYYENPGYLQWNFYYYFISSANTINENKEKRKMIENDESYARKFVMTENDFIGWLQSNESISRISTSDLSNSLYDNWVNFLRLHKLFFIYNETEFPNYKQPTEDYINGQPFYDIAETAESTNTGNNGPLLQKIEALKIITFRPQPEQRNFNFGKVNLIHGQNASGKTSFFDVIELIITGNNKSYNENYSLELIDTANVTFSFPDQNYKYKERDIKWYKSSMTRGHNLNGNFNRFNYYTSDAAFLLKQNDERQSNDFEQIIADIALGREVNRLEERITEFANRFRSAVDIFRSEEQKLSNDLNEKNTELSKLKADTKDPENYRSPLINILNEQKWKYSEFLDPEVFIVTIETNIQGVLNALGEIMSKNSTIGVLKLEAMLDEVKSLETSHSKISELKNNILNLERDFDEAEKKAEMLRTINPLINEIQPYVTNPKFDLLLGLTDKIKSLHSEVSHRKNIQDLSKGINELSFFRESENKSKTFKELEEYLSEQKQIHESGTLKLNEAIRHQEEGISNLNKVATNIKSLGLEYLKLEPNASACPLCDTVFPKEELLIAIEGAKASFENSSVLLDFKKQAQINDTNKNIIEENMRDVASVKSVAMLLYSNDWALKNYSELETLLKENTDKLNIANDEWLNVNTTQSEFMRQNLTELRFVELQNKIVEKINVKILNHQTLSALSSQIESQILSLMESRQKAELNKSETQQTINSFFNSTISDQDAMLRRIINLKELTTLYGQIESKISLEDNLDVFSLLDNVNVTKSVFETYKNAFTEIKSKTQTIKYIEDESQKIVNELAAIDPKKKNALYAFEVLDKLLTEQNKNLFLNEYIESNKKEISSIFRLIHSPKEFSEIRFSEHNQVLLVPFEGEPRTLNEISTGQRTALAISIFLSLNKKLTNGPDIILLDDPVTYVDDLNTLSFLDYLRELTLQTNRQLFFATANNDLAFLFKKKFEFLGDSEFKSISLSRSN